MQIESRSWNREEQTELPEPIKIRFTGKLRARVNERAQNYDSREVRNISSCRAYTRQKTNVVIQTEEEAYSVMTDIEWYTTRQITWTNGPMRKSARRVVSDIKNRLDEMGIDIGK